MFSLSPTGKLQSTSIPALGRPFGLGDLYDRKNDVIIQGPKLWNSDEVSRFSQSKTHSTKFEVSSSEKIDDGMSKFDINAQMKMSFLSGMISVSGSASYLKDKKRKNNQARVSLKYSSTTFTRALKPEIFTQITYNDVLDQATSATDVVVAIQYGAGAVFVFDRNVEENETRQNIEGSLEVAVKNIPSFEVTGSGQVKISEEEKKKMEKFSCKFHGDFVLKDHPGNYEEAIAVYKELPNLLGDNYKNSVPVKVWLYPIDKLPLVTSTLMVREIEQGIMTTVADKIEGLEDFDRQCNDLLDTQVAVNHERIKRNVLTLRTHIEEYIIQFKEKLVSTLPQVREGVVTSAALTKIIEDKENSPFNSVQLKKLISFYAEEVTVLKSVQNLPNYCKNDGDFSAKLINKKEFMIGLVMKLSKNEDEYLQAMKTHLTTKESTRIPSLDRPKWWANGSPILQRLQTLSYIMRDYHDIEEAKDKAGLTSNVQFYVREETTEGAERNSVHFELFENGKLIEPQYQIPSSPGKAEMTIATHDSITVKWDHSVEGLSSLVYYEVSVYVHNSTEYSCDSNLCLLTKVKSFGKSNTVTITKLLPKRKFYFQVSSFCQFGKTAESLFTDAIETTTCTLGSYMTSKKRCSSCAPGTFSTINDAKECTRCPRGMYSSNYGMKNCVKCPTGTYSDKFEGATGCQRCPDGTYNQRTGVTSRTECNLCPAGTYNPFPGMKSSSSCKRCGEGTYNPNKGEQKCYFCPFGTQSSAVGAKSHDTCQRSGASQSEINRAVKAMEDKIKENIATIKKVAETNAVNHQTLIRDINGVESYFREKSADEIKDMSGGIGIHFICVWGNGDGKGGDDFFVGTVDTKNECIARCLLKKKQSGYTDINGLTLELRGTNKRCWCERRMSYRQSSSYLESCIFT